MISLTKLAALSENFDKARAFELGFAKAAAELGLNPEEYQQMCKIAAAAMGADFSKEDAAGSPTGADFRARMASLSGPAGKEAVKNDRFLAQRKQQVVGKTPPPVDTSKRPNPAPFGTTPYNPNK